MRWFRGILALYVLVWFNAVVPGHTRGVTTLPGTDQPARLTASSGTCCQTEAPPADTDGKPTQDQKRRCAVCFVAKTYAAGESFFIDLRPAGLCLVGRHDLSTQVRSIDYPPAFYPTGPPTL